MNDEPDESFSQEEQGAFDDSGSILSGSFINSYYQWMTDRWFFLKMPWTGMILYSAVTIQIFTTISVIIAGLVVRHHREIWYAWLNWVEQNAEPVEDYNQDYDYDYDEDEYEGPWG